MLPALLLYLRSAHPHGQRLFLCMPGVTHRTWEIVDKYYPHYPQAIMIENWGKVDISVDNLEGFPTTIPRLYPHYPHDCPQLWKTTSL